MYNYSTIFTNIHNLNKYLFITFLILLNLSNFDIMNFEFIINFILIEFISECLGKCMKSLFLNCLIISLINYKFSLNKAFNYFVYKLFLGMEML